MQQFFALTLIALGSLASAVELRAAQATVAPVTPVEKVIQLLDDLKTEVEGEGTSEATTYDQFACFCRDMTGTKSTSITTGKDSIDTLSADIEQKTALKESKATELRERQATHEELSANLQETREQCARDQAEYEATEADLAKAIRGLTNAIQALGDAQPTSLLAVKSSVERTLDLAQTLDLATAKRQQRAVKTFFKQAASVDPLDPTYKYHSHGIIETLNTLKTEFTDRKSDVDAEWEKTLATCNSTKTSLSNQISENDGAMSTLDTDITSLKGEIASHRTSLVNKEALLKDDQLYLKDLTERCEVRAKDWDQRSQLRADELQALTGALAVLRNNVSAVDAAVNLRALLQRSQNSTAKHVTAPANQSSGQANASTPPSFLQGYAAKVRSHGFLRRAGAGSSLQARQEAVAVTLREAGQRLKSTPLAMLASRVAADPFEKVKTLIQQLVERLLAEATAEASKKGFCDQELGKARKDRKHRFEDSQRLSVEISGLESKFDELEAEISLLSGEVVVLTDALGNATADRAAEKALNLQTLLDANGGLEAVKKAVTILKVFYKRAGKATVLAQASPVDEDTTGAGFAGAYQGKQSASKGIIGMLEVIQTDFERTIRVTESMEKIAAEDFVKFDRASRSDISGKETKIQLDTEDLATTNTTMNQKMDDLRTAVSLLDSALQVLEDLKPTCIDTGMSYADRVAKREEEIQALKTALCQLDPDNVEPSCQ
mmetsp:Transcript_76280/g.184538  ORF Transcript_76280/g.184538 Transcript_76280/m.184538 type:complete len:723 (-) Transcript_76280:96-2264(-)